MKLWQADPSTTHEPRVSESSPVSLQTLLGFLQDTPQKAIKGSKKMVPHTTGALQVSIEWRVENSAYHQFLRTGPPLRSQFAQKSQQLFTLCDHLSCEWEGALRVTHAMCPHTALRKV